MCKKLKIITFNITSALASASNAFALPGPTVQQDNGDGIVGVFTGVLGPLAKLILGFAYMALAVLFGITLFKRGQFAEILKKFGEEDLVSDQVANIIGIVIYFVLAVLLFLIFKALF